MVDAVHEEAPFTHQTELHQTVERILPAVFLTHFAIGRSLG